jgi:hypothetical protein
MAGEIIRLTNWRHYFESGNSWSTFKVQKGKVCVAVIIGTEDKVNPEATDEYYQNMMGNI